QRADALLKPIGELELSSQAYTRALAGEAAHYDARHKNRQLECHIVPLRNGDRKISGCLGIALDVSEQRQTEATLRDSEDRYRQLVENSPGLICTHDLDGVVLSINPAAAEVIEYRPDEIVGHRLVEFIDPDRQAGFPAYLRRLREQAADDGLMLIRTRSGQRRVLAYHNTLVLAAQGKPYVLGHAQDVTDRVQAEKALRHSEKRFKDFAEIAADFFWEISEEGRFTYLSERCHEVMGVNADDMLNKTWEELLDVGLQDKRKWSRHLKELEKRVAFEDFEVTWIRPDGDARVIRISGRPVLNEHSAFAGYRGVSRDVTESYLMTQKIAYQATHDGLTGLVNRREFERRLSMAVNAAKRVGSHHALCYMDLDQFKLVNDTAGHIAGDELLESLSDILRQKARAADTLARLGGDEFGLLLENCPLDKALEIAQALVDSVRNYVFKWEDRTFEIGISIGLVPITPDTVDSVQALTQGDVACYTAKDLGRNQVHVYSGKGGEPSSRHLELYRATEIREALTAQSFDLFVQPIYDLLADTRILKYYEILVRLIDNRGNTLPPRQFIPAAERYGMMPDVDRWVVKRVLDYFGEEHTLPEGVGISINLSGYSIADEKFADDLMAEVQRTALSPSCICFEINENAVMRNLRTAIQFIKRIKALGCQFALDDFGSGLTSMAYLRSLSIDYLKIDGAFVREMDSTAPDHSVVSMINNLGHMVGTKTIAEAVENEGEIEGLKQLGVDCAQGYILGRPMSIDEVQFESKPNPKNRATS
ncbi:MAG: EAL domain-containing protein, partial [Gammaproteobacteria bacterium]|nr:EAL domain-containing protein [Gammaproteobacteria bacterium]